MLSGLFCGWRRRGGAIRGRAPGLTFAVLVALTVANVNSAFGEPTELEMSGRVPVAVGVGSQTEVEFGLNADLLWFPLQRGLGIGFSGQLTSLEFGDERKQLGFALAYMPDVGGRIRMGLGLDFGIATDARADYVYGRTSYQIRSGMFGRGVDYACSSALYLELRRSTAGPAAFEGSIGIELGGGVLVMFRRIAMGWN